MDNINNINVISYALLSQTFTNQLQSLLFDNFYQMRIYLLKEDFL